MPCDDTEPDPNLKDQCISIADGPSPNWWMSPDINLNGFTDVATTGGTNDIDIRVRRGPESCQLLPGTNNIFVEVWVSASGLILTSKQIATKVVPVSQIPAGGSKFLSAFTPSQLIKWTPTSTSTADPDGPGHRCLIARCFPEVDGPPQNDCFHVVGDPHVAQRNIEIIQAAKREAMAFAQIGTENPDRKKSQRAILRVLADLQPDKAMLNILAPGLKQTPGFKRIARVAPDSFGLYLPDFPKAEVATKKGSTPTFQADIVLKPGQRTRFSFVVNVSKSQLGDAHIFHLMHLRPDRRIIGGLTLAAVVV